MTRYEVDEDDYEAVVVRLPFEHQMALKCVSLDQIMASTHLKEFIKKKPLSPLWDEFLVNVWHPAQAAKQSDDAAAYKDGKGTREDRWKPIEEFVKWLEPHRIDADSKKVVEGAAWWPRDAHEVSRVLKREDDRRERKQVEASARKAGEQGVRTWTTTPIINGRLPAFYESGSRRNEDHHHATGSRTTARRPTHAKSKESSDSRKRKR